MSFRQGTLAGIVAIALAAAAAPAAHAFDAAREANNYSKINERFQHVYGLDPDYEANLAAFSAQSEVEYARILATDGPARTYGRDFTGNLCAHHGNGCAGDIRYYGWATRRAPRSSPCSSPRATARRSPATSGPATPAPGTVPDRDHQWLGAGARGALLVHGRRPRARRLRRHDVGPAGPGLLGHLRRRHRSLRRRSLADRRAVLRRHRGRAGLLLLEARAAVCAAPLVLERHEPRGQAAAASSTGPTRRTTRSSRASIRAASASPATRSAPARSPTSARSIRA